MTRKQEAVRQRFVVDEGNQETELEFLRGVMNRQYLGPSANRRRVFQLIVKVDGAVAALPWECPESAVNALKVNLAFRRNERIKREISLFISYVRGNL
jgi:hypothetical protein